jgi:hypothetical protein
MSQIILDPDSTTLVDIRDYIKILSHLSGLGIRPDSPFSKSPFKVSRLGSEPLVLVASLKNETGLLSRISEAGLREGHMLVSYANNPSDADTGRFLLLHPSVSVASDQKTVTLSEDAPPHGTLLGTELFSRHYDGSRVTFFTQCDPQSLDGCHLAIISGTTIYLSGYADDIRKVLSTYSTAGSAVKVDVSLPKKSAHSWVLDEKSFPDLTVSVESVADALPLRDLSDNVRAESSTLSLSGNKAFVDTDRGDDFLVYKGKEWEESPILLDFREIMHRESSSHTHEVTVYTKDK